MAEAHLNPYRNPDGAPQMRRSVAAFLDILGYQEYIKRAFGRGEGQKELERLRGALDTAYEFLKAQSKEVWVDGKLRFQIRSFTDNLIIGHPASTGDSGLGVLMMLIHYVSYIQADFAQKGYFIRGGIAAGDLYVDDDIIFGPALLEAYEAEHQAAAFLGRSYWSGMVTPARCAG